MSNCYILVYIFRGQEQLVYEGFTYKKYSYQDKQVNSIQLMYLNCNFTGSKAKLVTLNIRPVDPVFSAFSQTFNLCEHSIHNIFIMFFVNCYQRLSKLLFFYMTSCEVHGSSSDIVLIALQMF